MPIALVVAMSLCAACFLVLRGSRAGVAYLRDWAIGGGLIALALLCLVLRGRIADPISIIGGNVGLTMGYMGFASGTGKLYRQWSEHSLLHVGGLLIVLFLAVYASGAPLEYRSVVTSVMLLIFSGNLVAPFWRHRAGRCSFLPWLAIVALCAVFAGALIRVVLLASGRPNGETLQGEVIAVGILLVVGLSLVLGLLSVMLVRRRFQTRLWVAGLRQPPVGDGAAGAAAVETTPWILERGRRELITPAGRSVALTGGEYLVMQLFAEGGDAPVSRQILNATIGRGSDNPKDRSIDILISRLRRKCAEQGSELPVLSVRGRGYVMHGELQAR